jgi:hypothetical protein
MAFAQLDYRESLRNIEGFLAAQSSKLYHMGFRQAGRRSTLADANAQRDWRIYADFAQRLITLARKLYIDTPLDIDWDGTAYALDSTTIDLCMTLFPWAPFRSTKSAVKMHTLPDLKSHIPSFIHISDGKFHDVKVLDLLLSEPGAFYIMDRAYVDFERLHALHAAGAFFVTRAKRNLDARRLYSAPVERDTGIICDQTIALNSYRSSYRYPDYLRRVRFKDPDTGNTLIFLTNHFKQHLRIESFFGTSENAVKSPIWIAVSVYVLVAIVKKRLNLDATLYTLLQIVSLILFEKTPLQQALRNIKRFWTD